MIIMEKYEGYDRIKTVIKRSKAQSPDAGELSGNRGELKKTPQLQRYQAKILKDDELRAFLSILRDAVINSGYQFVGTTQKVEEANKKFKELKFRKKFKRIAFDSLTLLHSYVELEKNKANDVIKLNIPDASLIYPKLKLNGDVVSFHQDYEVMEKDKKITKTINWSTDEMVHFTIDESSADYYGVNYVETLDGIIKLKDEVFKYILNLFETNAFKLHYHGVGVNPEDVQKFYDMIMSSYENNEGIVVTVGTNELEGKKYLDESLLLPLIELLNLLRNRILTLLRVPPIIAGTVDNSNRSNSDVQAEVAFKNRIRAIQEDLEDDINFELLPKLGLTDVEFKFKKYDLNEKKKLTELMVSLLGANADKNKLIEYVKEMGMNLPDGFFKEEEIESENNGVSLPPNSPMFESRKPQDNFKEKDYKLNKENR
ncbi:MAG: phage portal protein [Spirochaetia bacterium]|nr:phage portal protein [Spirochaetia bacterium]